MTTTTAVRQTATPELAALKNRQQTAWSSGNYAVVGTTLQIVGEQLCEALDLRGQPIIEKVFRHIPGADGAQRVRGVPDVQDDAKLRAIAF